jgi:hypothetical protein
LLLGLLAVSSSVSALHHTYLGWKASRCFFHVSLLLICACALQRIVDKGMGVGLMLPELTAARDCLAALQWAARVRDLLAATEVKEQQPQDRPHAAKPETVVSAEAAPSHATERIASGPIPAPAAAPQAEAEPAAAGPEENPDAHDRSLPDVELRSNIAAEQAGTSADGDTDMAEAEPAPSPSAAVVAEADARMGTAEPGQQPGPSGRPATDRGDGAMPAAKEEAAMADGNAAAQAQDGASAPPAQPPNARQEDAAAAGENASPQRTSSGPQPGAAVFTKVSPVKAHQSGKVMGPLSNTSQPLHLARRVIPLQSITFTRIADDAL